MSLMSHMMQLTGSLLRRASYGRQMRQGRPPLSLWGLADDAPSCAKANEQVMILTIKELEARVENLSRGGKDLVVRNFEMAEQRCEADKWSAEVRRCLRQATTIAAAGACSQRLDAEQRKHLDEALALRTFPEQTKAQAAKVAVLKLVHEAYPQWAMAKPGKASTTFNARRIWLERVAAFSRVTEARRTCSCTVSTHLP